MTCALQVLPSRRYDAELRKGLERGQYAWHGICSLVLVSLPSYGPTTQCVHSDPSPEGRTRACQHGPCLTQPREWLACGSCDTDAHALLGLQRTGHSQRWRDKYLDIMLLPWCSESLYPGSAAILAAF
jgi:hypothetical protein